MKRAVLYARVSSDDRGREGRNLASQLEMCREYAQQREYIIAEELSEDDRGASGANIDLPKLTRIRDMAQASEFDVLIVREIDRLSRSLAKQLIVEEELERAGVQIEYVLGDYDNTPEGDLQKHVKAAIAEYERAKITERMRRGRRQMVRAGNVLVHGQAPYGYRIAEADGKRGLAIDEDEARVVRLIFTWYADGDETGKKLGSKAIARRLTEMGVPTLKDSRKRGYKKRGYGKWADGTITGMLDNETYIGRWYYGKKHAAAQPNPRDEWLMVEVPQVISPELWERAQAQKETNKAMARRNTQ
jgi:site-specific DNA recombinase